MSTVVGYWVDLKGKQFDDDGSIWIQAMPTGSYDHPVYGEITFDADRVKRFADSVTNKVRGTDLDIDYDHKADTKIAAGWVKAAEVRGNDGLFLKVQFTEKARNHLKAGEYRYFSPEFQDEWEHPKTKVKFQDVLFGGALTNRPFLKDIMPINLSEVFDSARKPMSESDEGKKVRDKLGLPESATEAEVLAALATRDKDDDNDSDAGGDDDAPQLSEADLKKFPFLKNMQAQLKKLTDARSQDARELAELKAERDRANAEKTLAEVTSGDGRRVLSTSARELAANVITGKDVADSMTALLRAITAGSAVVELGERGRSRTANEKSGVQTFNDAVAAVRAAEPKLTYGEALNKVLAEHPEMYTEYRDSLMAGEGVN